MKFLSFIFICLVLMMLVKTAKADTTPVHNSAYCSGYASAMGKVYRMKYYYNMQKFFDSKINSSEINDDELSLEYFQSGSEFVKTNVSISNNLNSKCENEFKRKT